MAVAARECNWAKACEEIVDFSITRADGTVVLVHPRWKNKGNKLEWFVRPPRGTPTAIMPDNGRGVLTAPVLTAALPVLHTRAVPSRPRWRGQAHPRW